VRFVNYGEVRPDDLALAARLDLATSIELPGYVHYADAARVLSRAHVLLLEQRNDESVQIPGKLYDYLLARRPILSLSRNPELAEVLAATQAGEEVDPSSPTAVAQALLRLAATNLDAFEARLDAGAVRRFSAAETTRALGEVLDDVSGRHRPGAAHEAGGEGDGLDAYGRRHVAGVNGQAHHPRALRAPRGDLRVRS
jgi:glycosyltransferase involved in cell wall biosynthesis